MSSPRPIETMAIAAFSGAAIGGLDGIITEISAIIAATDCEGPIFRDHMKTIAQTARMEDASATVASARARMIKVIRAAEAKVNAGRPPSICSVHATMVEKVNTPGFVEEFF